MSPVPQMPIPPLIPRRSSVNHFRLSQTISSSSFEASWMPTTSKPHLLTRAHRLSKLNSIALVEQPFILSRTTHRHPILIQSQYRCIVYVFRRLHPSVISSARLLRFL